MTTDFAVRLGFSYSLGAYLAVNAIPDMLLVVDGKDCVVQKASQIQGNHDWCSDLVSSDGAHRVLTTQADPKDVWRGRDPQVAEAVNYAIARSSVQAVLLGAMRMASITEPPYEMILRDCAERTQTSKPLLLLPTRSLRDDWLAGYADTLVCLANGLPLQTPKKGPRPRVGLVGYLWDRNEEDHRANLRELRRSIEGIGAELVSTWLSGESIAQLSALGNVDAIVSLPYGRKAAEILSQRLEVPLLVTELPLGLEGTSRWLRKVANALGLDAEAESFIAAELSLAAPKLEWIVSLLLAKQSLAFLGDPHLLRGFVGLAQELGISVPFRVVWAEQGSEQQEDDPLDNPIVIVDPREGQLQGPFAQAVAERGVQMVVGNSYAIAELKPRIAAAELGFPSFHTHALTDQPFLGYRGCLSLIGRLTERLKMHELLSR